ncbi:hypothetical protein LOKO_01023 [Halomonas chromatireducens]|uniref:Glycosyl transferase family 28 C-terminal domain-containing protein n=1 Tax=Halomonas chromatireducens TaxID=507626 RepID=A0A0X8HCK0_9GAMM|nr:hypothetical protein LOKO_01023 [Halomonas chromatireducens]
MRVLFAAGTQFSFPRLDEAVLSVARQRPAWKLVYQAGPGASLQRFASLANLDAQALFSASEFISIFDNADLVVTHAGMGNIMACLEQGKPFLMLPRLARLGEHRNDHQVDTAEAISRIYGVPFFQDVEPLVEAVLDGPAALAPPAAPAQRIHDERQAFGKQLKALIQQL